MWYTPGCCNGSPTRHVWLCTGLHDLDVMWCWACTWLPAGCNATSTPAVDACLCIFWAWIVLQFPTPWSSGSRVCICVCTWVLYKEQLLMYTRYKLQAVVGVLTCLYHPPGHLHLLNWGQLHNQQVMNDSKHVPCYALTEFPFRSELLWFEHGATVSDVYLLALFACATWRQTSCCLLPIIVVFNKLSLGKQPMISTVICTN